MKFKNLYIHVPFCRNKCAYCTFYSLPDPDEELYDKYLVQLEKEFTQYSSSCDGIQTVYIGGGTPVMLPEKQLENLFQLIHKHFNIDGGAEISIECNPEELTESKAAIIAESANRLSLGIQSFNSRFRDTIGRRGNIDSTYKAFDTAISCNLSNISCDLIYAIPGQSIEDWQAELKSAMELPVKHLSAYSLTIEESAKLADFELSIDDEISTGMWELCSGYLSTHGFHRYEISNYAVPGFECRHNMNIWHGESYLGCGPAASSFDGNKRWTNPADIYNWLRGTGPEYDIIPPESRAREIFIMGLRTSDGWDAELFHEKTGFDCMSWLRQNTELIEREFLIVEKNNIRCTNKGLLFWNDIAERMIV